MVDVVMTWVDGKDPVLRALRQQYLTGKREDTLADIAGPQRFLQADEIRFSVASILRFAPFVGRIFIVTNRQDPHLEDFVEKYFPQSRVEIHIVDQNTLFHGSLERHLPVFNSISVETVICRIPGLSDRFIYMNDDFTQMLSEPKLLFEAPLNENGVPRYTVIDSDIIKVCDTYNLFYVSHEKGATVKHATSPCITGPYVMDDKYDDGEKQGHEAPNCWKRLPIHTNGQDTYVVMFDNYSRRPHNFGFVETNDLQNFRMIGYFDQEGSPMKRTNFSEQKHAAVAPLTVKEAKALEGYWKKRGNLSSKKKTK
mgnify:CR=1 FL=1